LGEDIAEMLIQSGVATVEKLGSMTPEELEAIPGIEPEMVEKILIAVNAYYAQFEPPPVEAPEVVMDEPAEVVAQESVEAAPEQVAAEQEAGSSEQAAAEQSVTSDSDQETPAVKEEFDNIGHSGEVS